MTMEAQFSKGALWKRLIDSMKDLVSDANFDCSGSGISIQAMDQAHVALVSLGLQGSGFQTYSCPRQQVMGVNLNNLSKILKVIDGDDVMTLRHEADADILTIAAQSSQEGNLKRNSEFQLKLIEIEAEAMGIPDLEYKAHLSMPSDLFAKVVRDMSVFGETITMEVAADHVSFLGTGDIGQGFVRFESDGSYATRVKPQGLDSVIKREGEVKTEPKKEPELVKAEPNPEEDEQQTIADRYPASAADKKGAQKANKKVQQDATYISVDEPIQLSFAIKYLLNFAKGSTLSDRVEICLAKECPCRIEYGIEGIGFLRWYLAPKVDDENE